MARKTNGDERPGLTESPEQSGNGGSSEDNSTKFVLVPTAQGQQEDTIGSARSLRSLHPYTRPLTVSDLDSCVALENAAFENPAERCSPEKFKYRLTKCGELSLGIFCTATPESNLPAETLATGNQVETCRQNKARSVLLAHVVATKTRDGLCTDESMDYPRDWETNKKSGDNTKIGHHEEGRTICVHSLAVLPAFQKSGIGRTLMVAYMMQMNGAGIADRLALVAHASLVTYYEKLGFVSKGPSKAQFGGGGWIDMTYDLKQPEARAMYG